jgi:hypothetical protein
MVRVQLKKNDRARVTVSVPNPKVDVWIGKPRKNTRQAGRCVDPPFYALVLTPLIQILFQTPSTPMSSSESHGVRGTPGEGTYKTEGQVSFQVTVPKV